MPKEKRHRNKYFCETISHESEKEYFPRIRNKVILQIYSFIVHLQN